MNQIRKTLLIALSFVLLATGCEAGTSETDENDSNIEDDISSILDDIENDKDEIDINTASQGELKSLPGIGDVLSRRIINYRDTYGDFTSLDELQDVDEIGPVTVDKIRPHVNLEETSMDEDTEYDTYTEDNYTGRTDKEQEESTNYVDDGDETITSDDRKSYKDIFDQVDTSVNIKLGSNKDEVRQVMGEPDNIELFANVWEWDYGESTLIFDESEGVVGWDNTNGDLKVSLGEKANDPSSIKEGDTMEMVVRALGTPERITHLGSIWFYEDTKIEFDERKIIGIYDAKS